MQQWQIKPLIEWYTDHNLGHCTKYISGELYILKKPKPEFVIGEEKIFGDLLKGGIRECK